MAMKIYLTVCMPLLMIICCYTSNVVGADPGPLQDFCVADQQSKGKLLVGFVDTNNTLFSKILEKGDVFVFPKALPHFQENVGHQHAVAIAAFNSQFPGILTIANSLFAANPPIPDSVLAKAFRITHNLVDHTKAEFEFEST
ncbi:hypothetical protein KI387_028381, partial [Taxus chinensis]